MTWPATPDTVPVERPTKRKVVRKAKPPVERERTDDRIRRYLSTGQALRQIDSGFASGALTFPEAQALYAEQALVRLAYIAERGVDSDALRNLERVMFMMRTAQATIARLTFNDQLSPSTDRATRMAQADPTSPQTLKR